MHPTKLFTKLYGVFARHFLVRQRVACCVCSEIVVCGERVVCRELLCAVLQLLWCSSNNNQASFIALIILLIGLNKDCFNVSLFICS